MNFLRKNQVLLAGVGLIVLVNAIVLAGVAYNRRGSPDAVVQLSERELTYYRVDDDNSGVSINFNWHVMNDPDGAADDEYSWKNYSRSARWLTDGKLKALGFDTAAPDLSVINRSGYDYLKDREVFLVLEFNGPAYRRYVQNIRAIAKTRADKKRGEDDVRQAEKEDTRLFVVDAGTDADALRQRYPDRQHYVVAKGVVSASWQMVKEKPALLAYIKGPSIGALHVAKPHDAVFADIPANDVSAKFQVKLAYGRRHEPWILSASK